MRRHVNDAVLIQAVRKRLLDELRAKHAGGGQQNQHVNVYGGGGGNPGGMVGGMHDEAIAPEDRDYFVNIDRRDVHHPETGEKIGWDKKVHRFTTAKDEKKKT